MSPTRPPPISCGSSTVHLAQGETKAAALRAAKLSFLRSGNQLAQPQYWAAFVLNGDGRVPIPRVFSWMWIAAAAILVGGLIFLYRHRRRSTLPSTGAGGSGQVR